MYKWKYSVMTTPGGNEEMSTRLRHQRMANYMANGAFKKRTEGQEQKENECSRGRLACEVQPEPVWERKRE